MHEPYMCSYSDTYAAWRATYDHMLNSKGVSDPESMKEDKIAPFRRAYGSFILNRPELAIHYLRELLRARAELDATPDVKTRFIDAMEAIGDAFGLLLRSREHSKPYLKRMRVNWSCLLRAGLCRLCKEALTSPDFFDVDAAVDLVRPLRV